MKILIINTLDFLGLRLKLKKFIALNLKRNVFKSKNKKRVLISYIIRPFDIKPSNLHTNQTECLVAAQIFKELGFNVDVIEYTSNKKINYSNYEIIYGFGKPLENSFFKNKNIKRIFYSTGCNMIFLQLQSVARMMSFYKKTNIIPLDSFRLIDNVHYN